MTEGQKKIIETRTNVLFGNDEITEAESYITQIQADIARQLTRIADVFEDEPNMPDGIVQAVYKSTPVPDAPTDALVEAVKRFLKENAITNSVIVLSRKAGKETIDVSIDEVKKLIAAYEKAVM